MIVIPSTAKDLGPARRGRGPSLCSDDVPHSACCMFVAERAGSGSRAGSAYAAQGGVRQRVPSSERRSTTSSSPDATRAAPQLIDAQFNTISPENVLKWERVHPSRGTYDFVPGDAYVDFGTSEPHGDHRPHPRLAQPGAALGFRGRLRQAARSRRAPGRHARSHHDCRRALQGHGSRAGTSSTKR